MTLATKNDPHVWGTIGEGPRKKHQYLSFGCFEDDLARFDERLKALGVKRVDAPPGVESNGLWLHDHDGNLIEIAVAPKTSPSEKSAFVQRSAGPMQRGAPNRSATKRTHPRRLAHVLMFTTDVLKAIEGSGLGILRGEERSLAPRSLRTLVAKDLPQSGSMDAIILTKTNARARVHRPGYMDYIGVLAFDAAGVPVSEQRFLGLFTTNAYMARPQDVPLVRRKVDAVLRRSGLRLDSHSGKALRHVALLIHARGMTTIGQLRGFRSRGS